jgi:hypothetical protein
MEQLLGERGKIESGEISSRLWKWRTIKSDRGEKEKGMFLINGPF